MVRGDICPCIFIGPYMVYGKLMREENIAYYKELSELLKVELKRVEKSLVESETERDWNKNELERVAEEALTSNSKNRKLEVVIKDANSVIDFYATTDNWNQTQNRNNLYLEIMNDASDDFEDGLRFGGKHARNYKKKWGNL